MPATIYATSREYIHIPVAATDANGQALDLAADTVEIAAVLGDADTIASDDIDADDWHTAAWAATNQAAILIGPGGDVELDAGLYQLFVRITDNPEVPVLRSGALRVL